MELINFIEITPLTAILLILVGFVGGMVSGFIGSGGAFVLTPAMMTLGAPGIVAVASNICHKFPKALVGAVKRNKYGQVDVKLGLILGLFAVPLGLMIGRLPFMQRLLDPTLQVLRPIPDTAWLPLSMIMFGLGPRSAFFLVCLGAFYPILLNTIFGVRSVDPRLFEAASMLGCEGTAQFFRVVLPASLPAIFTGLRLGLGFAWVVIVVGEMTGVQTGLGAIIMEARQLSRTEIVICGMIVIGIAGFISDRVILWLGRYLLKWSPNLA